MKYFGIFSNSGDVQTALNESALTNPYVALVSGALDYNSIQPTPPAPTTMGYWTHDAETGSYTFHITETDPEGAGYWNETYIGKMNSVMWGSDTGDADITLDVSRFGNAVGIYQEGASDGFSEAFDGNIPTTMETGFKTGEESDDSINISWDGENTFIFFVSPNASNQLSINTYDPPYPEEEASE